MTRKIVVALVLSVTAGILFIAMDSQAAPEKEKMLRHCVMFKFKEDATKEQVKEVVDALAALPKKIDSIVDFENGVNNSEEGRSKGFTHVFLITFKDEKGREKYLPHPAHNEFIQKALPIIDDVLVVDYWTAE